MKIHKTIESLEKEYLGIKSIVSEDTKFMAGCLLYIARNLDKLKKPKREPSAYNLHIAKERAKGKTFFAAIESWKKKKD